MDHDPSLQVMLTDGQRVRVFTVAPSPIHEEQWVVWDSGDRLRPRVVEADAAVPAREDLDLTIRRLLDGGWVPV